MVDETSWSRSREAGRQYAAMLRVLAQSPFAASLGTAPLSHTHEQQPQQQRSGVYAHEDTSRGRVRHNKNNKDDTSNEDNDNSSVDTPALAAQVQSLLSLLPPTVVPAALQAVLSLLLDDALLPTTRPFRWSNESAHAVAALLLPSSSTSSSSQQQQQHTADVVSVAPHHATLSRMRSPVTTATHISGSGSRPSTPHVGAAAATTTMSAEEALARVQLLVCLGQREEAVHVALQHRLHSHAILIAMMCRDKASYVQAVRAVVEHELHPAAPLAHAYCLFNELPLPPYTSPPSLPAPTATPSHATLSLGSSLTSAPTSTTTTVRVQQQQALRSSWRLHAAAMVSNFTRGSVRGLLDLSDELQRCGLVMEAHTCLLLLHLTPLGTPPALATAAGSRGASSGRAASAAATAAASSSSSSAATRQAQAHVMDELRRRLGVLGGCYMAPVEGSRVCFLSPATTLLTDMLQEVRLCLEARQQRCLRSYRLDHGSSSGSGSSGGDASATATTTASYDDTTADGSSGRRRSSDVTAAPPPPLHGLPVRTPRYTAAFHFMQVMWLSEAGLRDEATRAWRALSAAVDALYTDASSASPLPQPRAQRQRQRAARRAAHPPGPPRTLDALMRVYYAKCTGSCRNNNSNNSRAEDDTTATASSTSGSSARRVVVQTTSAADTDDSVVPHAPGAAATTQQLQQHDVTSLQQQRQQQLPPPPQSSILLSSAQLPPPPPPPPSSSSMTATSSSMRTIERDSAADDRPLRYAHADKDNGVGDMTPSPASDAMRTPRESALSSSSAAAAAPTRGRGGVDGVTAAASSATTTTTTPSRRSRSIEALVRLFRRGKSEDARSNNNNNKDDSTGSSKDKVMGGAKKDTDEVKPMILDTAKPPAYDKATGRWLFEQTDEEKAMAEMVRRGPPKMPPGRLAQPPQQPQQQQQQPQPGMPTAAPAPLQPQSALPTMRLPPPQGAVRRAPAGVRRPQYVDPFSTTSQGV